jgi:hypothetical protein
VGGLATGADTLYFPIVQYGGAAYYPEQPVTLTSTEPFPVQITVFEPSPQPDGVRFDRLNMLLMGISPTTLTVMEMGAVVNESDRTYAADPAATGSARTLRFILPDGAIQVTPQVGLPGDTLESTPDGFASTDPIKPGRREIAFSYQLPYTSASLTLARSFAFPVDTFTLYVPPDAGEVVAPGMAMQGTADFGGRQFRQYVAQQVVPGSEVRFRLTGLPAPLFARPQDLGMAVVAGAGVILLAFLVFAVRRSRPTRVPADEATAEELAGAQSSSAAAPTLASEASAERLALIRAVAELDERFAEGALDEDDYRSSRAKRKARLVELTRAAAGVS